jgi:hypothetical protein
MTLSGRRRWTSLSLTGTRRDVFIFWLFWAAAPSNASKPNTTATEAAASHFLHFPLLMITASSSRQKS